MEFRAPIFGFRCLGGPQLPAFRTCPHLRVKLCAGNGKPPGRELLSEFILEPVGNT